MENTTFAKGMMRHFVAFWHIGGITLGEIEKNA